MEDVIQSYCTPVFPRGTGLGNRLFHWCDAKLYSYRTRSRFISPIWLRLSLGKHIRQWSKLQLNINPILDYTNSLRPLESDLPHCKGLAKTLFAPKAFASRDQSLLNCKRPIKGIAYFDKSNYSFEGYESYRERLCSDLHRSLHPKITKRVHALTKPYIGIHLRLGDGFKAPEPGSDGFIRTGWLQQTPIAWFVETLAILRRGLGEDFKTYLFSDGTESQLAPLLGFGNTEHFKSNCPVTDLFALSGSRFILGSGSSSFSAFAAFLGSAHTFTAHGHPLTNRGLSSNGQQVIASVNPREADDAMLLNNIAIHDHHD